MSSPNSDPVMSATPGQGADTAAPSAAITSERTVREIDGPLFPDGNDDWHCTDECDHAAGRYMCEHDEARLLEHAQVLRLQPGDVIVLTYPDPVSVATAEILKERVRRIFPGHQAMILDMGAEIAVVRETSTPEDLDMDTGR